MIPFIPYSVVERAYNRFLRRTLGLTRYQVKKQSERDDEFLVYHLTYSELQEVFEAGWDAAIDCVKKSKTSPGAW